MKKYTKNAIVAVTTLWFVSFVMLYPNWGVEQLWWQFPFFITGFGVFAISCVRAIMFFEDGE